MNARPLTLGSASAMPGELAYGWFELAALPTGHAERLPVLIARGRAPGPTLWLTANIHGDEVTGLAVIHEVVTPALLDELRGAVVALPSLNPAALHTRRRQSFLDRRDPNRLFPDSTPTTDGVTLEERRYPAVLVAGYARLFDALRGADYLIDLHCYGLQASCFVFRDRVLHRDEAARPAAEERATRLAELCEWTGLPVVNEVPAARYVESRLHRSTSGAALNEAGVPAITVELGLTGAVDPPALVAGVTAVRNALRGAGMLPGAREPITSVPVPLLPYPVMRELAPRARNSGIVRYHVRPGDVVRAGDRVASLMDLHGRPLADGGEVLAEQDGWILALPRGAICYQGEAVVHMAVRDEGPMVERFPGAASG